MHKNIDIQFRSSSFKYIIFKYIEKQYRCKKNDIGL